VLHDLKRIDEALASYDAALAIDPTAGEAAGGAFNIVAFRCDWDERDKRAAVLTNLALGGHAVEPFNMIAAADNPEAQGKGAAANIARRTPPNPPWPRKPRPANPKIRLGYLSGDFHNHPVAHLTAPLFEAHDRGVFEILGFSSGPSNADPMRKRLEQSFDKLFDVHGLSDAQVAQGLAELNVDIAIDLSGHTKGSRTAALSYRPAPLAVNMLGFPGTTGAPYIDYIIADKRLIPESAQAFYAEKPVYLPESYMPNHAERKMGNASSRAEAGLPEQGFVFCAFNGSYKITREIFIVWMRLLQAVPHSVLWLNVSYDAAVERLRREAQARGVAAERLVFAPNLPDPGDHLARLQLADVFLDTDVYNAHATAADTLWAGVPVITCPGRSFAARVASSLVSAAGMPELAVTSRADYETLALQFAREPERLRAAKAKLIASRASAPLFDTQRYRGHLESAYRRMWERAQRGLPPESFAVS
jgi:predicted O-linked N-acetylglucosamine transferase (SPINDLY family)